MNEAIPVKGEDFLISLPKPTTENAPGAAPIANNEPAHRAVMLDDHGTEFDPKIHNPVKRKDTGRWMPKGGRKPKARTPENSQSSETRKTDPFDQSRPKFESQTPSFVAAPKTDRSDSEEEGPRIGLDSRAAAQTATAVLHVISMRMFGATDGRFTSDEVKMINEAAFHVADKRQVQLSPEWALAVAVATVFGSRLTTPKGLSLVQRWRNKIVAWWESRSARRAGVYVRKTQKRAERMARQEREKDDASHADR